jgi:hypothetical protein
MLWRKVFASKKLSRSISAVTPRYSTNKIRNAVGARKKLKNKSYRSGHKEAVIASDSYCSGNILAVIAFITY